MEAVWKHPATRTQPSGIRQAQRCERSKFRGVESNFQNSRKSRRAFHDFAIVAKLCDAKFSRTATIDSVPTTGWLTGSAPYFVGYAIWMRQVLEVTISISTLLGYGRLWQLSSETFQIYFPRTLAFAPLGDCPRPQIKDILPSNDVCMTLDVMGLIIGHFPRKKRRAAKQKDSCSRRTLSLPNPDSACPPQDQIIRRLESFGARHLIVMDGSGMVLTASSG